MGAHAADLMQETLTRRTLPIYRSLHQAPDFNVRTLMRDTDPAVLEHDLPDTQRREWMPCYKAIQIFANLNVSDLVDMCTGLSTVDNVSEDGDADVEMTDG